MNFISRSVTRVFSSSLYHSSAARLLTQKWVISRQITSSGESEATVTAAEKELAQEKQIEYQQELSNSVNLFGLVDAPVKSGSSSDGNFWAGTVISRLSESKLSSFWVPVVFVGDLAQTAVQHLKKDDRIHISGKLFPNKAKSNPQVIVQTLNFVQAISPDMTISPPEIEETISEKKPSKWEKVIVTYEDWKHLLENPKEWLDHRGNKANGLVKPGHPDFKRKEDGLSLWQNMAPDWVLPNLEGLEFDVLVPKREPKQLKEKTESS